MKFTWKIGNRLIRKKNQFSDFYDFYFSSYGHFSVIFLKKSPQFSMITRKIKIGKKFYSCFRSIQNIAHHLQSLFDGVISERGGVGSACPSLWHSQNFYSAYSRPFKFDHFWKKFVEFFFEKNHPNFRWLQFFFLKKIEIYTRDPESADKK